MLVNFHLCMFNRIDEVNYRGDRKAGQVNEQVRTVAKHNGAIRYTGNNRKPFADFLHILD